MAASWSYHPEIKLAVARLGTTQVIVGIL